MYPLPSDSGFGEGSTRDLLLNNVGGHWHPGNLPFAEDGYP